MNNGVGIAGKLANAIWRECSAPITGEPVGACHPECPECCEAVAKLGAWLYDVLDRVYETGVVSGRVGRERDWWTARKEAE